jgi:hypothetical protein
MYSRHTANVAAAKLSKIRTLADDLTLAEAVKAVGITTVTYYRWLKKYDGMSRSQAKWLAELQAENDRLRRIVRDLELDNRILAEVSKKLLITPADRRACVDAVVVALDVSERRACRVLGQHRSTQRKTPRSRQSVSRVVATTSQPRRTSQFLDTALDPDKRPKFGWE